MSKSNSILGKISASGRKRIVVPVVLVDPLGLTGPSGCPLRYSCRQIWPSRRTSASSHSDSALTTVTPTPCKPAGDLVGIVVEFAAGVNLGQDDFERAHAAIGMSVDRDASAVIDDRDRTIRVQRDVDVPAVAGHRLVDRIIDDLVDQVMQPARRRVTDIHPWTQPNRLDPLEHPDVRPGVVLP